jgi:hypothetical protein
MRADVIHVDFDGGMAPASTNFETLSLAMLWRVFHIKPAWPEHDICSCHKSPQGSDQPVLL